MSERQDIEHGERQGLRAVREVDAVKIDALEELAVQDGAAEDGEPDDTEQSREEPLDEDELAKGSAVADADHEEAEQRSVCHPVNPPVHIPVLGPAAGIREGSRVEAGAEEIGEVGAQAVGEEVADVSGRSCQKNESQQDEEETGVEVGEERDTVAQSGDSRQVVADEHDPDDDDIHAHGGVDAREGLDGRGELHGAVAETAGNRAGQSECGPGVKGSRPFAVCRALAEEGDQAGAGLEGGLFVEDKVGQDHAHDDTGRVRGEAPLQEAVDHGPYDGTVAAGGQGCGRIGLHREQERLSSTPEDDAGADARAEGDTKPLQVGEFRFCVGSAELDLAHGCHENDHAHDNHEETYQGCEPSKSPHQVVHDNIVEDVVKRFRVDENCCQHGDEQDDRHGHDRPSDLLFFLIHTSSFSLQVRGFLPHRPIK